MAITYTWNLKSIKVQNVGNFDNTIVQTYWQKIGTDENGNQGIFDGATPFNPDPSKPDFKAFEKIKEKDILGWIQTVVSGSYEKHVNEKIQQQIDHISNPVAETDFPWIKK